MKLAPAKWRRFKPYYYKTKFNYEKGSQKAFQSSIGKETMMQFQGIERSRSVEKEDTSPRTKAI